MTKEARHEKAEQFRQEIALPGQRAAAIRNIVAKDVYDETDNLRIRILLQKPDYVAGCKSEYGLLLRRLIEPSNSDESLKETAKKLFKRWFA